MITIDELVENFQLLGDWEERYRYIIDLAKRLPEMTEEDKTEETRVHGCMSNVWVKGGFDDSDPPVLQFIADSDAFIVKGLLALLRTIYVGKTPEQVLAIDIQGFFNRVGLMEHLSPNRQNGLYGMVERIRDMAKKRVAERMSAVG